MAHNLTNFPKLSPKVIILQEREAVLPKASRLLVKMNYTNKTENL